MAEIYRMRRFHIKEKRNNMEFRSCKVFPKTDQKEAFKSSFSLLTKMLGKA